MTEDRPALRRDVDLSIDYSDGVPGGEIVVVRCPYGVAPRPAVFVRAAAPLVAALDGTRSLPELEAAAVRAGYPEGAVTSIVAVLREGLLLDTPRSRAAEESVRRGYLSSDTRPSSHAGLCYPEDPALLGGVVAEAVASVGGDAPEALVALKAPHIDYARGGAAYPLAYRRLPPAGDAVVLLIGTCHRFSERLFVLSRKHFANPLGTFKCDAGLVSEVASAYDAAGNGDAPDVRGRAAGDEFLHRSEHSLDLQLPYLLRDGGASGMACLVGGFGPYLARDAAPFGDDRYESFVSPLAAALGRRLREGRRLVVVAGVDMAHVGPSFGDPSPFSPRDMEAVALRDEAYLDAVSSGDASAVYAHAAEDGDRRRLCGMPTMVTVLDLLSRLGLRYRARRYHYGQAYDPDRGTGVTFASVGFAPIVAAGEHLSTIRPTCG